jgi:ABC-type multidrug transport system ATPase subunit
VFNLVDCKLRKTPDLSGGEKRKLGVAMALCGGSKFIVLDEPTAGYFIKILVSL